eukprot:CAMPEP_0194597158 /NCGR_PEP_ID=MMETSP0292-20121207/26141_1 /TAXON_ID=39354 /ORGANISM="Heterosigma akashiwo, Strain CCMP2393" /LENGTH=56 /DNA_ID=CAMNT_0039457663 /DNA_START=64 /DNA_END=230 /DNA_ORIENTATION=+
MKGVFITSKGASPGPKPGLPTHKYNMSQKNQADIQSSDGRASSEAAAAMIRGSAAT